MTLRVHTCTPGEYTPVVGGPKNVSLIAAMMASYAASDAAVEGFCVYALWVRVRECAGANE